MNNENKNRPSGGIEPFNSQAEKNIHNDDTVEPVKKINIEPVNREELSALLSEPTGYADIVKQIRKETISQNKTDQMVGKSGIPEYDLGKQMLAEHRKDTAARRTAPGQKAPIPIRSIPTPAPVKTAPMVDIQKSEIPDMQSEMIIREIVARDIIRLCRCSRA